MERWLASRANRGHSRWLAAAAVALALVATMVAATRVGAEVTVGQLPATAPPPQCSSTADYLQPSITSGNLYIARQAGTITSWSTRSSGGVATYVFKTFRRTSDPDLFMVNAHAPPHPLTPGLNTVFVNIPVRPGDMIGLNESGGLNSCTFVQTGDAVLTRDGNLADGASGSFTPENDVRLNLSAVLVPSNDFAIATVARDRKRGSATVTVNVSNPGVISISAKGLKTGHPSKNVALAGTVQFQIASAGARKRKLMKTGKVTLTPTLTFIPAGGDPASTAFTVKLLRKRKTRTSGQSP